ARAVSSPGGGRSVAANGAVIEQAQILTTHNLAVLLDALGLASLLGDRLVVLADACFEFIVRSLDRRPPTWRKAALQRRKNAAYAWRQMVFFLALRPAPEQEAFLERATARLATATPAFRARFSTVLDGLHDAVRGKTLTDRDPRRFLGWTTQPDGPGVLGAGG
ncbi:MAG TPA: hypothetical protein VHF22_00800, partial [Planctomycetota bacterium]|nr:hypothetical protein [Planctomycetota bacterium]